MWKGFLYINIILKLYITILSSIVFTTTDARYIYIILIIHNFYNVQV